jgi:hypothetical protein
LVTPPMKEEGEQLRQELSETRAEVAALKGKLEAAEEEVLQVGFMLSKFLGVGFLGTPFRWVSCISCVWVQAFIIPR